MALRTSVVSTLSTFLSALIVSSSLSKLPVFSSMTNRSLSALSPNPMGSISFRTSSLRCFSSTKACTFFAASAYTLSRSTSGPVGMILIVTMTFAI